MTNHAHNFWVLNPKNPVATPLIVAETSIVNKVTKLRPLNEGGLYLRAASISKSLFHTVTCWYLNVTFLSVGITGHF